MDPTVAIYGIAVEAVERLREHDSDAAESLKEDLTKYEKEAFPPGARPGNDRMWAVVCLYSQAALLAQGALLIAKSATSDTELNVQIQQAIDDVTKLCTQAETAAGITALSHPGTPT